MFRKVFVFLFTALLISVSMAAEKPLASKRLRQALVEEVSGEIAFRYTTLISHFDRVQASEGWHEAALMIKKELKEIGYPDALIEGWPSNGSRYYYTYRAPIGWRAKQAELWLVSPQKERLCSYEEIPLTLVKHSNSADNVKAELIDVGTGVGDKPYQGKEVKGKIVLATGYTGTVMREAVVKRGALGVVTWYPPEVRSGYPNMIRYTAIWPSWEERDKIGFAFNVSKLQGWRLKKMLDEGTKVVLQADVEAEYYDSQIEVLSASYPGSLEPEKEVMIIGHLCHPAPSANDNASGSGGMLEMARALKRMVDKGLVDPPRRTIRFLWVPEFYGTIPYIQAHLERTRNTLAVINCDMIGEDLHKTGGLLNIISTPHSMPSYLNDVVGNFTKLAEKLNLRSTSGTKHPFAYKVRPFMGGSDHYIFNDGSLQVPAIMLYHEDVFHHTSLDTPDKVDPSELRRVCFIALGSSLYLAHASSKETKDMARLIARNGLSRLSADYYDSLEDMCDTMDADRLDDSFKQVKNVIKHAQHREAQAILSTLVFAEGGDVRGEVEILEGNVKTLGKAFHDEAEQSYQRLCQKFGAKPHELTLSAEEQELEKIIPQREENFVCPLQGEYLEKKLGEGALMEVKLGHLAAYEALNFADGRRSILDIRNAVSAEFGPVSLQDVHDFFKILEQAELIRLKRI